GRPSPYLGLLDCKGKVLFLGTSIRSMTLYHGLEELLEPGMPFSPFTKEVFELQTLNSDGRVFVTKKRLYDPRAQLRRSVEIMVPHLKSRGRWKESRVGLLPIILLEASHVWDTIRGLAKEDIYCYDSAIPNPDSAKPHV